MTVLRRHLVDEAPARLILPRTHVCGVVRVEHVVNDSPCLAPFARMMTDGSLQKAYCRCCQVTAESMSRQSSLRMERLAVCVAATLFKVLVLAVSAAFMGIVPVAVLSLILQEHAVSGLTSGGIKG
jgi:hypothetical protein